MNRLTFVVVAFGLFLQAPLAAQSADVLARGQKVYADQKCSVCHAVGGTGNRRGVLDDVGSRLSADEIRDWIVDAAGMTAKTKAERKPPMRSYANLAKEDLEALVAYMQSLKK